MLAASGCVEALAVIGGRIACYRRDIGKTAGIPLPFAIDRVSPAELAEAGSGKSEPKMTLSITELRDLPCKMEQDTLTETLSVNPGRSSDALASQYSISGVD